MLSYIYYNIVASYTREVSNDEFQELIWQKGRELYREMPWRADTRPYYVLVSELMLQQTQVERVILKFQAFIAAFPDEKALARASLADVLKLWQGLGYNRRAKFLHEAAKLIVSEFAGVFPSDEVDLLRLPGVGKNTAGAIRAYAFNQPSIFIETNVRTVYLYHFFADRETVHDQEISKKLEETIDREHPREWYQALMDYGSYLKKAQGVRNISQSKHYVKQAPLRGSVREVRGQIVRALAITDYSEEALREILSADERFTSALRGLIAEGLVGQTGGVLHLTK